MIKWYERLLIKMGFRESVQDECKRVYIRHIFKGWHIGLAIGRSRKEKKALKQKLDVRYGGFPL